MASRVHNPEKRAWRGRSYKQGGRRVRELREKAAHDEYEGEEKVKDTICECGHWFEEHNEQGCGACDECHSFKYSVEENTPEMIADRGGEHEGDCDCNLCRYRRGEPLR